MTCTAYTKAIAERQNETFLDYAVKHKKLPLHLIGPKPSSCKDYALRYHFATRTEFSYMLGNLLHKAHKLKMAPWAHDEGLLIQSIDVILHDIRIGVVASIGPNLCQPLMAVTDKLDSSWTKGIINEINIPGHIDVATIGVPLKPRQTARNVRLLCSNRDDHPDGMIDLTTNNTFKYCYSRFDVLYNLKDWRVVGPQHFFNRLEDKMMILTEESFCPFHGTGSNTCSEGDAIIVYVGLSVSQFITWLVQGRPLNARQVEM